MFSSSGEVSGIAHVIQLAVAPVFLFSGVAALLNVLVGRLSRIIDRARALESRLAEATPADAPAIYAKLVTLSRRSKLMSAAITLCTTCALLLCGVVVTLFLSAFLRFDLGATVAFIFVAAILALFAGLLFFLREIFLATASLRIGPR